MASKVMMVLGLISGPPTCFDGEYLVDYDPGRDGIDRDGHPMLARVVTTPIKAGAKRFADAVEALEYWRQVDPRQPTRLEDGQPNRPLTAFSVEVFDEDEDP